MEPLSKITGEPVVEGWISDPNLDFLGLPASLLFVVFAYLWQDIGYNLVIFIAALQAIPRVVEERRAWSTARAHCRSSATSRCRC